MLTGGRSRNGIFHDAHIVLAYCVKGAKILTVCITRTSNIELKRRPGDETNADGEFGSGSERREGKSGSKQRNNWPHCDANVSRVCEKREKSAGCGR